MPWLTLRHFSYIIQNKNNEKVVCELINKMIIPLLFSLSRGKIKKITQKFKNKAKSNKNSHGKLVKVYTDLP